MWQTGAPRPSGRIRFSPTEIRHLLLALAVLTAAFALAFSGGVTATPRALLANLLLAVVAVPTGFLLHELGHKVVAQRRGHWAEFRTYNYGLFLAVITALLGFLFAAPGAVHIAGSVGRRDNGRISLAGPLVNLAIGGAFFLLWVALRLGGVVVSLGGLMSLQGLARGVALINLFLGAFNLIPFGPLDGAKILRWDVRTYLAVLVPTVVLMVPLFVPGLL